MYVKYFEFPARRYVYRHVIFNLSEAHHCNNRYHTTSITTVFNMVKNYPPRILASCLDEFRILHLFPTVARWPSQRQCQKPLTRHQPSKM